MSTVARRRNRSGKTRHRPRALTEAASKLPAFRAPASRRRRLFLKKRRSDRQCHDDGHARTTRQAAASEPPARGRHRTAGQSCATKVRRPRPKRSPFLCLLGTGGESSVTGSQRAIAILRIWPASSRRHKSVDAQRASAQAFVNAYPPQQSLLTPTCRHSRTPAWRDRRARR